MTRSFRSKFPLRMDIALLVFRVWICTALFMKHGLEKVLHFQDMPGHFPDPIHIGARVSFYFAFFTDAVCSVLVAAGLLTRLAAFLIVINLFVVFGFMHHFNFHEDHAELVFVYLGGFVTLVLTGAGRFSVDAQL